MKIFSIVGFAFILTACGSQIVEFPIPSDDSGQPDSGSLDSGELDSSALDSGTLDSEVNDSGHGGTSGDASGGGGGSCTKFECKFTCMITHDSNRDTCEKAHDDCYSHSGCDANLLHQCDCDRDTCESGGNHDLAVCVIGCDSK
jgi:hypothetical protein